MTAPTSDSVETLRSQLDDAAKHIGQQRGHIQKLENQVEEALEERDIAQASSEKLADLISKITGVELGDYIAGLGCPGNDPILNAIDAAEQFIAAAAARASAEQSQSIADELVEVGEGA